MWKIKTPLVLSASITIGLVLIFASCSPKIYQLSTTIVPSDGGTINPSGGLFQGKVTLIATPAQYYEFSGWAGATSGNANPLTITMNSDKQIVATFARLTYNFRAQPDSTNGGTVQPNSGTFEAGTSETITAIPATGYRFDHWEGSTTGTSNPLNIVITTNTSLTAYFTKAYTLTISCSPNGDGTVSPGNGLYDEGTVQNITASTTIFPYAFAYWSGTNNNNTNPTTVTMNSDKSVTAYFKQLGPGTQQSAGSQISGTTTAAKIQLNAGQWIQGELKGSPFDIGAQIVDSGGVVIKDLGRVSDSQFTFQATTSGMYTIIIYNSYSILFDSYNLVYTIYQ